MTAKIPRDLLELMNFRPLLQDSRANPFLQQYLQPDEIEALERASIARGFTVPTGALLLGIVVGMYPGATANVSPWVVLALAVCLFYVALRTSWRIDRAWTKALKNYKAAQDASSR